MAAESDKAEDLRKGLEWKEKFKAKDAMKDADLQVAFWAEVKLRLVKKYHTIQGAFRELDNSGDGEISFLEFANMLIQISMPLDQRSSRALFEKASGGDRSLSLSELKVNLLAMTIKKLGFVMHGFNAKQERIHAHVHRFLRRLSQADEVCRQRAIDRYQRKLGVDFCKFIYGMLLRVGKEFPDDEKSRTVVKHGTVDLIIEEDSFAKIIREHVGQGFQAQEVSYMVRIFEAVDLAAKGEVSMNAFLTTLVLLSSALQPMEKVRYLVELFDGDYDGCLLFSEILAMMKCITAQRHIAEKDDGSISNLAFRQELTDQEGRRMYECILWHVQRTIKVTTGAVVSMEELVASLEAQPLLFNNLMPGTVRMRWAMDPEPPEEEPTSPRVAPRNYSELYRGKLGRPPDQANAVTRPQSRNAESKQRPTSKEGQRTMSSSQSKHRPGTSGTEGGAAPSGKRGKLHQVLQRERVGLAVGMAAAGMMAEARLWRDGEAKRFTNACQQTFHSTIREHSDRRMKEMTTGFGPNFGASGEDPNVPPEWGPRDASLPWKGMAAAKSQAAMASTAMASGDTFGGTAKSSKKLSHSGSATTFGGSTRAAFSGYVPCQLEGPNTGYQFAVSQASPAMTEEEKMIQKAQKQLSAAMALKAMSASASAPQLRTGSSGSQTSPLTGTKRRELPEMPHVISPEKFGPQSHERFRLFATATMGHRGFVVDLGPSEKGIAYKCQLCFGNHRLRPGGGSCG